ncbi:DUF4124 domain-containing protein [Thalassotalea ganghwensis]
MRNICLLLFVISISLPASQIYQCEIDGVTHFSQSPCGEDASKVEVKTPQSYDSNATQALKANQPAQPVAINNFIVSKKIKRLEQSIARYRKQKNDEIARIEQKSLDAPTTHTGGLYLQALSKELLAVSAKYDTMIEKKQTEIDALKAQQQ